MKNFIIILVFAVSVSSCNNTESGKTKVLTLGTIHGQHIKSNYSYSDIIDVLNTFNPDLICVEIRPKDFREKFYLYEMMLATAYGDMHNIPVVPMDFWNENNDRLVRDSLKKIEKYIKLIRTDSLLEAKSNIINNFKTKYKTDGEDIYKNINLDINFWNGKDYNDQVREGYKISVAVFGDSPFNLHYLTRNSKMLNNIKHGIEKYNAKKVIILTGAEHKSFFDDSIKIDKKYIISNLNDIEPLRHFDFEKLLKKVRPKEYFISVDTQKIEMFYNSLLTPWVHGPDMDFNISNIDLKNLPHANTIIKNWEDDTPNSLSVIYERVWYHFLMKNYDKAIMLCSQNNLNKYSHNLNFYKGDIYRVLGFCYDLNKERQKAIDCYKKARKEYAISGRPDWVVKALMDNYENKPYSR